MSLHRIRPFGERDLVELEDLCREHAEYERAVRVDRSDRGARLGELLASEDVRCWVVEGEGELGGFASAMLERSTWDAASFLHLDCLYLRPAYRGRGLGSDLMGEVAAAAEELGALNVQWQTPAWNQGAARFYERLGATSAPKLRFTLSREQFGRLAP